MTAAEVQDLLYRECGLKGLSGVSNDVRELLASNDPQRRLCDRLLRLSCGLYAGMLAAALGGLDAFVFTAGIGENSGEDPRAHRREAAWLGATLDPAANARIEATDLAAGKPRSTST